MSKGLTKVSLGPLCKNGHDHEGTGKSLRFTASRICVACNRKPLHLVKAIRWEYHPELLQRVFALYEDHRTAAAVARIIRRETGVPVTATAIRSLMYRRGRFVESGEGWIQLSRLIAESGLPARTVYHYAQHHEEVLKHMRSTRSRGRNKGWWVSPRAAALLKAYYHGRLPQTFTLDEAAALLGVARDRVQSWIDRRLVKATRGYDGLRIEGDELLRVQEEGVQRPATKPAPLPPVPCPTCGARCKRDAKRYVEALGCVIQNFVCPSKHRHRRDLDGVIAPLVGCTPSRSHPWRTA